MLFVFLVFLLYFIPLTSFIIIFKNYRHVSIVLGMNISRKFSVITEFGWFSPDCPEQLLLWVCRIFLCSLLVLILQEKIMSVIPAELHMIHCLSKDYHDPLYGRGTFYIRISNFSFLASHIHQLFIRSWIVSHLFSDINIGTSSWLSSVPHDSAGEGPL